MIQPVHYHQYRAIRLTSLKRRQDRRCLRRTKEKCTSSSLGPRRGGRAQPYLTDWQETTINEELDPLVHADAHDEEDWADSEQCLRCPLRAIQPAVRVQKCDRSISLLLHFGFHWQTERCVDRASCTGQKTSVDGCRNTTHCRRLRRAED